MAKIAKDVSELPLSVTERADMLARLMKTAAEWPALIGTHERVLMWLLREVDRLSAEDEAQRRKAIFDYLDQNPDIVLRKLSDVTGELEVERDAARMEGLKLGKALQDVTRDNERLRAEMDQIRERNR